MIDFTSSLYLGLRHGSDRLAPWAGLTTGRPAALGEPAVAGRVLGGLAGLVGCDAAALAGSTLHLAWDLLGLLASPSVALYLDAGTYPVLGWGVERARGLGAGVRVFRSHDPAALGRRIAADGGRLTPVVVTDGSCPRCGRVAPLPRYLELARGLGGLLLVDDTQALGILGEAPAADTPYGVGGGGSLRRHGIEGPDTLLLASLAKGFGVPLAVLAGSGSHIGRFVELSQTRVHCSPPSLAALHAAERALEVNRTDGDRLRAVLATRVARLRRHLVRLGVSRGASLFPVQVLDRLGGAAATRVHRALGRAGIRTVLLGDRRIAFVVTAGHSDADVDAAAAALAAALTDLETGSDWRSTHACRHDGPDPLVSPRSDPARPRPARSDPRGDPFRRRGV